MRVDLKEARLGFDMGSTKAITTTAPHMLKEGGAVSFRMNGWMVSGEGGGESNKVG